MNKTQSFDGIIGSHQAMRRGGCQGPFTTGYYAVSDLDSDSAVVGLDWWIDVINGHDEVYLGFRRLPARIPDSARPEHFNQHCWVCRGSVAVPRPAAAGQAVVSHPPGRPAAPKSPW